MKENFTDEAIIQLLATGDQAKENRVFAFLFRKYKQELQRYLVKGGLPSMDDAEEIFHDALITLHAKSKTGSFQLDQKNAVRSYLYAVCRNLANKKWRSAYRNKELREEINMEEEQESILSVLIEQDQKDFFRYLVSIVGEKCKEILVRRFYLKHKHEDIAEDLGYASAQVSRNKTFSCVKRLKEKVKSFDNWQEVIYS